MYQFKKDGGEDDDPNEKASRGNWWQGIAINTQILCPKLRVTKTILI